MAKNIVVFSDGTGNKGGTTEDTNVFKLYNAVKGLDEQFTYYDNGVGTSKHAVARAIGGATGFGFRGNVRDLYEFVGRHYQQDYHIYGFGFSRGAATIRAFAGMVETCGLVRQKTGRISPDGTETVLDEAEFQRHIDKAMANYADSGGNKSIFQPLIIGWRWIKGAFWSKLTEPFEPDRAVKIEFLGLWDTVAALGFPR